MSAKNLWRGRAALAATVVIWSTPPIFQYALSKSFDPWTQNFYRYAAGFVAMAPFLLFAALRSPRRLTGREWIGCGLASFPNVLHQVAQTMAVMLLWPGIYALLGRISVIMTAVLAVVFLADERWIARSFKFQAGVLLGLAGVAGLVWAPGAAHGGGASFAVGFALALAAAFGWALYAVLVKKYTARVGPTIGFGAISFLTTALLLPLMIAFGDPAEVLRAGAWPNFLLFFSGAVSIGAGHWLYYVGIRELGAAPAQSALLLCPLGTMIMSAGFFGERFRPAQVVAGAVLIAGAFLALSARPPVIEEPA